MFLSNLVCMSVLKTLLHFVQIYDEVNGVYLAGTSQPRFKYGSKGCQRAYSSDYCIPKWPFGCGWGKLFIPSTRQMIFQWMIICLIILINYTYIYVYYRESSLFCFKALLKHGACIEAEGNNHWTSLICASSEGYLPVVQVKYPSQKVHSEQYCFENWFFWPSLEYVCYM